MYRECLCSGLVVLISKAFDEVFHLTLLAVTACGQIVYCPTAIGASLVRGVLLRLTTQVKRDEEHKNSKKYEELENPHFNTPSQSDRLHGGEFGVQSLPRGR